MKNNEIEMKRPPAMNIYGESCELLLQLEPIEAGNTIIAAISYYLYGEIPQTLSKAESLAFSCLRAGIERSAKTYTDLCAKKQAAALKRWERTHNTEQSNAAE